MTIRFANCHICLTAVRGSPHAAVNITTQSITRSFIVFNCYLFVIDITAATDVCALPLIILGFSEASVQSSSAFWSVSFFPGPTPDPWLSVTSLATSPVHDTHFSSSTVITTLLGLWNLVF